MWESKYEINTGDRFGKLTIIGRDFEAEEAERERNKKKGRRGKHIHYVCRCDCGNIKTVVKGSLVKGATTSCGCNLSSIKIGDVYGNLKVVGVSDEMMTGNRNGKHKYFDCLCGKCGGVKPIRSSDLTSGYRTDCGCRNGERISAGAANDLLGKEFGHLTVVKRDMDAYEPGIVGKHARWLCACDICGSITSISSQQLLSNGKDRCSLCSGRSNGEKKIKEILDNNYVIFDDEVTFDGCVYPETGYKLIFDFVVYKHDGSINHIIEYDGIQHFKPIKHWDKTTDLNGRQERDKFKNDWCVSNNIPLIRIPYTHLSKIQYSDLIPETSEFLINNKEALAYGA